MKNQAVLALLFIALVSADYTCPKFKCGIESMPSLDEVCSKRVITGAETLYQLRVCSSYMTQSCAFMFSNDSSICVNTTAPLRSLLPGEPCQRPEDCMSNVCAGGFCTGNELGYTCKTDAECKVGAYCSDNGKCEALAVEGSVCGTGKARCMNHLACALGICVPMGSLEEGAPSDNLLACKTLFTAVDSQGTHKCAVGPKLQGYTGKLIECTMGQMCEYTLPEDKKLSMPCKCGVNGEGKSFCRPGEGDMAGDINTVLSYIPLTLCIVLQGSRNRLRASLPHNEPLVLHTQTP